MHVGEKFRYKLQFLETENWEMLRTSCIIFCSITQESDMYKVLCDNHGYLRQKAKKLNLISK